jgi:hypothetical protein
MRTHHREHALVAAGLLLFSSIILLLATGCEQSPTGGCPPSFQEEGLVPLSGGTSPGHLENKTRLEAERWFCVWFPHICDLRPMDPFDPIYYWGGPDFNPKRADVAAWADFHNACLTAWRTAEPTAEGLLHAMEEAALACGLDPVQLKPRREILLEQFEMILGSELQVSHLPSLAEVRDMWRNRPADGPFAKDERLGFMLAGLDNGIDPVEAEEWKDYARSLATGDLREYWTVSNMAATVEWWREFEQETGQFSRAGLAADLAAMSQTQDWRVVAVASLAGALIDVIEHFWPQE